MARKKLLYPGLAEVEKERSKSTVRASLEEPDWVGGAPNYDKFSKWSVEEVLVWLNID